MTSAADPKAESVAAWALRGALAGLAYGVVECLVVLVLLRTGPDPHTFPLHPGFALVATGAYALAGALACALARAALRPLAARLPAPAREDLPACVATALVVIAFAANLFVREPFGPSQAGLFALCAALLVALAVRARSSEPRPLLDAATSPWTASLLLLGTAWVELELLAGQSRIAKVAAAAGSVGAVLALAAIAAVVARRRRFAGAALAAAALAHGASFALQTTPGPVVRDLAGEPASERPDVVLVVLDTVRADRLSVYGAAHATTPFLAELSRAATVFESAFATSDMTLPSHASMFTGRFPRAHGAHSGWPEHPYGRPLGPELPTLAGTLAAAGWATVGVAANHAYLGPEFGLDRGFESYHAPIAIPWLQPVPRYLLRDALSGAIARVAPTELADRNTLRAEAIADEALGAIAPLQARGERFFLFLNLMDAHWPYLPPAPFADRFPGRVRFPTQRYYRLAREVMIDQRDPTDEERQHLLSQYDGALAYLDSQVERLVGRLKELGRWERCLFVVTADHGEAFGERHLIGHGVSVHQDQVHVPLIVKLPGQTEPRRIEHPVTLADLMPTVLAELGCALPDGMEAHSLFDPAAASPVISVSYPHGAYRHWHPRFQRTQRAIVAGALKLVTAEPGATALYDLARDPLESADLSSARPDDARALEAAFERWLATSPRASETSSTGQPGDRTIEQLDGLGYVE